MAKDATTDGTPGGFPVMSSDMTFADVGSWGLRQFSGWVREEFLPQLTGRQAARVFREMSDNNATCGSILFAITQSLRNVKWQTIAADDSPEAAAEAEFAESLRTDMSHTWEDFITEVLSMLTYGFSPHEIVYKKRLGEQPEGGKIPGSKFSDGRIGLRRLPIRGQDTIIKWFFDPNGSVRGMTQQPWTGPMIDLPIEKLLLFRPTAHKNNPEGRSILRNAYQPYYYVKRLQELEAIMLERMSGLPIMKIPSQMFEGAAANNPAAVQALAAYKRIVSNVRVDEQMGIVLPSDTYMGPTGPSSVPMYEFDFAVPGSGKGTTNFDTPITRYKIDIMTSVLADWLTMGHESRGTQSLAGTKVDMFFYAMEGWLDAIAAVLNRYLLPRIWRINGLDLSLMPQWLATMPRRIDIDALGSFILSLAQSGMQLFPDEDLENYIRDAAGLPDLSDHAEGDSGGSGNGPMSAADLKKVLLSSAAKKILAKRRG